MEYISFSAHVDFVQNKGFIDGVQVMSMFMYVPGRCGVMSRCGVVWCDVICDVVSCLVVCFQRPERGLNCMPSHAIPCHSGLRLVALCRRGDFAVVHLISTSYVPSSVASKVCPNCDAGALERMLFGAAADPRKCCA